MTDCAPGAGTFCSFVAETTGSTRAAQVIDWLASGPLRVALIVLCAVLLSRVASRTITRSVERLVDGNREAAERNAQRSPAQHARVRQRTITMGAVIISAVRVLIGFVAFLLALSELDIDLAPLLAGAGIAGIAIGFGAQSLVRDVLAGIFVVIEDHYGVGDIVDIGPAVGTIEEVSLRTTRLRDVSGVLWTVPNGEIRHVGNHSQRWSSAVLDVEVAYDTDVDDAMDVIGEALRAFWQEDHENATIISEPEVLGIEAFSPDAVVIRAVVRTDPSEQYTVARALRARVKAALDEAGVEIPFPQRTVWLRDDTRARTSGEGTAGSREDGP